MRGLITSLASASARQTRRGCTDPLSVLESQPDYVEPYVDGRARIFDGARKLFSVRHLVNVCPSCPQACEQKVGISQATRVSEGECEDLPVWQKFTSTALSAVSHISLGCRASIILTGRPHSSR